MTAHIFAFYDSADRAGAIQRSVLEYHLGNVRLSYKNTSTTGVALQIVEENNYYPFGLKHKGYNNIIQNNNSAASKFKYNDKELNDELGLDWYDYGARNYDAGLGRWMNIDPLAEKYYNLSPYNYAANNPIRYVDYDGKDFGITIDFDNNTITFSANYFFGSNEDYEANKEAIANFNAFEGVYKNKDGQEFNIIFNIKPIIPEEGVDAKRAAKIDVIGNFVTEVDTLQSFSDAFKIFVKNGDSTALGGFTTMGKIFQNSVLASVQSREHEIGHSLGAEHKDGGVMRPPIVRGKGIDDVTLEEQIQLFATMRHVNTSNMTSIVARTLKHLDRISRGKRSELAKLTKIEYVGTYSGNNGFFKGGDIKIEKK